MLALRGMQPLRSPTLVLALALALAAPAQEKDARPSIVLFVADDLGYAETGAQGSKDVPTPHIDSIAGAGVRMTDGYVTCPVCAPTRAGLLTGRYQQRFGLELNPGPVATVAADYGLPAEELTLAERLRATGYATGMYGKWHLGFREGCRPHERGFAESLVFLAGAHAYRLGQTANQQPMLRNGEVAEVRGYMTDVLGREAAAFVDRHAREPFFLYVPFNAVHAPMQAPTRFAARFAGLADDKRRTFAGMLAAMDEAVGAVLDKLREHGLEERTLVFFVSDNGGPTPQTTSANQPLRGTKGQLAEGGIRVPFFVQWKGHLTGGATYARPVSTLDVHATVLAAAGVAAPTDKPLDGFDLVPFLRGEAKGDPHATLCWRYGEQWAIRKGDRKLVQLRAQPARLFDLAADLGEAKDLAADRPDDVAELRAAYEEWAKGMVAPRWTRR